MDRAILLFFIAAIIGAGLLAGGAGLMIGNHDSWSPREYVPANGDCFVPPQGDPLYDEHYAKNVNTFNCDAVKTRSEAKNIDADTGKVQWQVKQSQISTTGIMLFALCVVGFFVWAILK